MNSADAKKLYIALIRARKFDEKVGELYPEQEIKCPVHLSLGQEGSAAWKKLIECGPGTDVMLPLLLREQNLDHSLLSFMAK